MTRQVIAQGLFSLVERCECGALYLTIGPVCVKVDPGALPELRETLAQAARSLGLEAPSPPDQAGPRAAETTPEVGELDEKERSWDLN